MSRYAFLISNQAFIDRLPISNILFATKSSCHHVVLDGFGLDHGRQLLGQLGQLFGPPSADKC